MPNLSEMFQTYLEEEEGLKVLVTPMGFVTYRIEGKECLVPMIYIKPEYREMGEAKKLGRIIAQKALEAGCTHLSCTCDGWGNAKDLVTRKMKSLLNFGFEIVKINEDQIILAYRLGG